MNLWGRQPDGRAGPWTWRDDELMWTCRIVADVQAGRPRWELPNLSTPFPPVYSRDERTLAIGKFQLADYVALGDGNWSSPGFVALGSPWFMAGTLLGSSIAKNRARSRAAADAVPRWVWIAQGTLYTTTHGWHMYTPKLMSWGVRAGGNDGRPLGRCTCRARPTGAGRSRGSCGPIGPSSCSRPGLSSDIPATLRWSWEVG